MSLEKGVDKGLASQATVSSFIPVQHAAKIGEKANCKCFVQGKVTGIKEETRDMYFDKK